MLASESQFLTYALFIVTGNFIGIPVIIGILVGNAVNRQGSGGFFFIQPGFGITEFIVAIVRAAKFPAYRNTVTGSAEVFIPQSDHADKAIRVTVAGANAKGAGIHFHHGDFHLYRVRLAARIKAHVYVFKKAQIINALHGTTGQRRVKGFAFFQADFPQDHSILGFHVAFNFKVFYDPFVDQDSQGSIRQQFNISNTRQDVASFFVFRLDLLEFGRRLPDVYHLPFRQIHHFPNLFRGDPGISFHFQPGKFGVFHYMISNLDAFRYSRKRGTQIIKPAHRVNRLQILCQRLFRQGQTGFADHSFLYFLSRNLFISFNADFRYRFIQVRSNFRVALSRFAGFIFHRFLAGRRRRKKVRL